MEWLVLIGALVSVAGLVGLVICIFKATRLKRQGLEGDALSEGLRPLIGLNLASLAFSVIGLMLVILGLALG